MTKISQCNIEIPSARLGKPNSLPPFTCQYSHHKIIYSKTIGKNDLPGRFHDSQPSVFPYLTQDNYDRKQRMKNLSAVRIENNRLKSLVCPGLGGRMLSLYDKQGKRELLFRNPVFQPANLALRNAWFSGGIEWNYPVYGHAMTTCSPVYCGTVKTGSGKMLRIYEFDRIYGSAWQLDIHLPEDSEKIWAHVKLFNPNDHRINIYWWTNVAVPLDATTRVACPFEKAITHLPDNTVGFTDFPDIGAFDGTYPQRYPFAYAVFFKNRLRYPWICSFDGEGNGIAQLSSAKLPGRKLFTWGNHNGARRWHDLLAVPGKGSYLEIQSGITETQLQTKPLDAHEVHEWTEVFFPFQIPKDAAKETNYENLCSTAEEICYAKFADNEYESTDDLMKKTADMPVDEILSRGTGWGFLAQTVRGASISPGIKFKKSFADGEKPWYELVEKGYFSKKTLDSEPAGWNISDEWLCILRASAKRFGWTWLHHLFIGTALIEKLDFEKAGRHLKSSLKYKSNLHALRNLAICEIRIGRPRKAYSFYMKAWNISGSKKELAVEIAKYLESNHFDTELEDFHEILPKNIKRHERILISVAKSSLRNGHFEKVHDILMKHNFAGIRENETILTDIWFEMKVKAQEKKLGRKLKFAERKNFLEKIHPPHHLDFRTNVP